MIPVHKWQDRVDGTPGPMPDLIELGGQIIHRLIEFAVNEQQRFRIVVLLRK